MLELKNIQKSYHTTLILDVPSLQLNTGIYWIQGTNGSGKTTLLKMIAGLLDFKGDILFNNINIKRHPLAYRQQISWAEAEPLYPDFITGMQLIVLYQSIRKSPKQEIDKLMELFNIGSFVGNPVGTYSAGTAKKLSLLLAFLGKPKLVVLDEPLITLDAETVTNVCSYILDNYSKHGTYFLLSSHQELDARLLTNSKQITISNQTAFIST